MKFSLLSLIFLASVICQAQNQYSFVFLHKKPDAASIPKEELDKIMQGHLANIERLAAEDKLKVAGPFEGGGGIFILNTTSVDEATQWLSTDPGIQAKRWNIEILPYTPQLGSVCSAKEPYEMVMYHFIRFQAVHKAEIKNAGALLKEHIRYIEKLQLDGNVITTGTFEPNGDILILKGDLKKELTDSDPGVQAGVLSVDVKKLWIAKGSFCEK
jgi:uncharacterized protein YciI